MIRIERLEQPPDGFLSESPEGGEFHRAFLRAKVPGFQIGYLSAWRDTERVAVVPFFLMRFCLNTMLREGFLRRALAWASFDIACVGHPSIDIGQIDGELSRDVLEAVNALLFTTAPIVAYKGFDALLPIHGFARCAGLPVAVLHVTHDFWSKLSSRRRNKLKRRLKQARELRVEELSALTPEQVQSIYQLYEKTRARATLTFEHLNPEYFAHAAEISRHLVFFDGDDMIGFIQLLIKSRRVAAKYLGMDDERGHRHGLYFYMLLRSIEVCLRESIDELDTGVTAYAFKRSIGSELLPTWNYYRHAHPVANWVLAKFRFLLEPSPSDLH